ncbi:MAG: prepilin-type N-terminal cleavage/methylation domain-containing protein [Planctomycetota bacterium]
MTARRAESGRRGMTLIEVLLALALLAILSVFVVQVVRSVLGLWQTGERRSQGDLAFQATLELFRSDLSALHLGSRGWMILDEEIVVPGGEAEAGWTLPRLRFLAEGSAPDDGSDNPDAPVEIAWFLVPSDPAHSRLSRLMRLARRETPEGSLRDDRFFRRLVARGEGLLLLDGVAWTAFGSRDRLDQTESVLRVSPGRSDFPVELTLHLERIPGSARRHAPLLDQELTPAGRSLVLRGSPPVEMPPFGLLGKEWIRLGGGYPRMRTALRAARGTRVLAHPPGSALLLPEIVEGRFPLPAGGRRIVP